MCERHFYRCLDCLSVAACNERLRDGKCGACGGYLEYMGRVQRDRLVTTGTECACDDRCTSALGPICGCKCGGINHGTHRVVSVTYDHGDVPTLNVVDTQKSRLVAQEWREAVEAVSAEYASLNDRKRYSSGWLSEDDFSRLCKLGNALRAARKLRQHAARMKRLAPFLTKSGQQPATTGQQELF